MNEIKLGVVKQEYLQGDVCMSELLRQYPELNVEEKRYLLQWSGDEEHMIVTLNGDIISCDEQKIISLYKESIDMFSHDELDFYSHLIDVGLSVCIVRKYLGNECAEHMKEFCENHGLI